MGDKTFVVTHAKAREPLTITGKSLKDALKKAWLDPATWKEIKPVEEPPEANFGKDN